MGPSRCSERVSRKGVRRTVHDLERTLLMAPSMSWNARWRKPLRRPFPFVSSFLTFVALASSTRPASALETEFADGDFKVRWTNTLRSTVGVRTTSPDAVIGSNPAFTSSEYSFAKGGFSTARADLLSDLDVSYEGWLGAKTTFAGWYDAAYQNH